MESESNNNNNNYNIIIMESESHFLCPTVMKSGIHILHIKSNQIYYYGFAPDQQEVRNAPPPKSDP